MRETLGGDWAEKKAHGVGVLVLSTSSTLEQNPDCFCTLSLFSMRIAANLECTPSTLPVLVQYNTLLSLTCPFYRLPIALPATMKALTSHTAVQFSPPSLKRSLPYKTSPPTLPFLTTFTRFLLPPAKPIPKVFICLLLIISVTSLFFSFVLIIFV